MDIRSIGSIFSLTPWWPIGSFHIFSQFPHLSPSLNHRIGWWDNLQPWFPVNFPLNQSSDLTMPNFHMTKVQFLFPWRSPRFVWGWSPMNWSSEMQGENWSKSPVKKNSFSRCLRWYFFPIFGGLEHEFYFSIILGMS
jgi:hypothetical protein